MRPRNHIFGLNIHISVILGSTAQGGCTCREITSPKHSVLAQIVIVQLNVLKITIGTFVLLEMSALVLCIIKNSNFDSRDPFDVGLEFNYYKEKFFF